MVLDAIEKPGNLMVSIQSVTDLANSQHIIKYLRASRGTYMSRVFCNSITDSLFEPLEVLVEKSLFFEQHGSEMNSNQTIGNPRFNRVNC